ncbi:MAG: DUF493 domain-containing protein [Acidiferrobacterales bacterium]|nr:DUF493 domain-containing protein [Acidiferrobacterales bacterium]
MTEKQLPLDDVKDGFDLIEYPCDYLFKAMCKVADGVDLERELCAIITSILTSEALLKTSSTSSRTGKFCSYTMTVKLENREQLETVYQAIANSPFVVMTL